MDATALFYMQLATTCQRSLGELPDHRVDVIMRLRIWKWFSDAQKAGIVLG